MWRRIFITLLSILAVNSAVYKSPNADTPDYWQSYNEKQLKKIRSVRNEPAGHARNIIIFIGDGMGMASITAGRILKGQLRNNSGEEETLVFEQFPNVALSKTYNVDKQVPDSAATATAIFSSVKTRYGTIGLDQSSVPDSMEKGKLTTLMNWAQTIGKRTGFVTTTRVTHATPAALYAHTPHRDYESDLTTPLEFRDKIKDIARQLVEDEPGNKFNVIMGGGKDAMGATNVAEPSPPYRFTGPTEERTRRGDSRNLMKEWLVNQPKGVKASLALDRDGLFKVNTKQVDSLMGIFMNNHMNYEFVRNKRLEPSLSEMVEKAIEVLDRDDSTGFVLMVEGGRIDHAHHQNHARLALHEVLELDKAVSTALNKTSPDETLIIVTADHSHAVTMNGYPNRGADILGLANKPGVIPYETLTYANGPGFYEHRLNKVQEDSENYGTWAKADELNRESPIYRNLATFPLPDETHGGEDVPVFATGPGAHLIRGVFEQSYIGYLVSYLGCAGPASQHNEDCPKFASFAVGILPNFYLLIFIAIASLLR